MQRKFNLWCLVGCLTMVAQIPLRAQSPQSPPPFPEILALIDHHFAAQPQLRDGDIISQREVRPLFSTLDAAGWKVADRDDLLKKLLPPNSTLIRILRSPNGTKFMRQVSGNKLIFDRLDRISQEPGGQRLLTDLVKLPDAARYAKQTTQPGVPDLIDFLPKYRSGKTRRVNDYGKPTKKIYTVADFNKAIKQSYEAAREEARAASLLEATKPH